MPADTPRAPGVLALLVLLSCARGETFSSRPPRLVSRSVGLDQAMSRARRAMAVEDLAGARAALAEVLAHPDEPLGLQARVMDARLSLAEGATDIAGQRAASVPRGRDPALDLERALVLGLVAARTGAVVEGLAALRPLRGRMIDPAQTAEVECGLAALEPRARAPGAAAVALARVEALFEGGTTWLPTGLPCDRASDRAGALRALLPEIDRPRTLADVLDALPEDSSLRVAVALRLRSVAERLHETARWLRWLADLPDDEATIMPVVASTVVPEFVLGVLAPLSGPRSVIGVDLVRSAELALESERAVRILTEDEGSTPAEARAAFSRLAARGASAVVGPSHETLSRAVALEAAGGRVVVYLVAPHGDASEQPTVRVAGPALSERAVALAGAARALGTQAVLLTPEGGSQEVLPEFEERVRQVLGTAGVTLPASPRGNVPRVVVGLWGAEAYQQQVARPAAVARGRWVLDARSALAGTPGVWVGLRPGPAFEAHHARYCRLVGAPPRELGLLAYDAAREAFAEARGGPTVRLLAAGQNLVVERAPDGHGRSLAALRRCVEEAPPPPMEEGPSDAGAEDGAP